MNILIVNTYYYPNMIGGAEHSVKLLAEGLVEAGHKVAVLCESVDQEGKQGDYLYEQINDVEIYRDIDPILHCNSKIKKFFRRIKTFKNNHCAKLCGKIDREFHPDVVHTNNLQFLSTYVWQYFYQKNIPVIFTARDYWLLDHSCVYNRSNKFLNFFYKKYYRKQSNRFVDILAAPSQLTLDIFKKENYFKNIPCIRVVNCIRLDVRETQCLIKKRELLQTDCVRFLYVGALGAYKGIINLLQAFHNVENPNIHLTICGRGEEEQAVLRYCGIDNRIEYLGQLNSEELKQIYISHDVLIAPSVWDEPFGRIVIEANQFGLPVIGSDRGGIKEILESTRTGEIFPAADKEKLADMIKRFSDRDVIKAYFPAILESIEEYSLEKQIENYIGVYKQAIEIKNNKKKG